MTSVRVLLPWLALALGTSGLAQLNLAQSNMAQSNLAAPTLTGTFNQPATAAPDNSVPIGGYRLVSFTDNGFQTRPASALTLDFDGQRASGFAGCNNFGGSYVARQNVLRFGALATTRKACPGNLGGLESQYLKLLRRVNRFELSGQTLTLFSGSADRLVYQQGMGLGEIVNLGIRGPLDGSWVLSRLPAGLTSSQDPRPIQFIVRGSTVSGFDGCNQFSGQVNTSSGRLMIVGPLVSTKVACPTAWANLAPLLLSGAAASVKGTTLTLTGADGAVWVFVRQ